MILCDLSVWDGDIGGCCDDDIIDTTAVDESNLEESGCSEAGLAELNKDGKALSLLDGALYKWAVVMIRIICMMMMVRMKMMAEMKGTMHVLKMSVDIEEFHQVLLSSWVSIDWLASHLLWRKAMELKVVQKNIVIMTPYPHDHYYNHHHHTITSSHHYDENFSIPYCQLPPSEPSTIDILVGGQNVNEVFTSHFSSS